MELLKQRILRDGQVKEGGVLKVDSFLNHQMDVTLLNEIGREFRRRFDGADITKIVTIEASGIGIAAIAAQHFGSVPVIFAKKTRSRNLDGALYTAKVHSFTKDITYDVQLSKKFLGPQDTVLILDDFLARGQALLGLIDIVRQAGQQAGVGRLVPDRQLQGLGITADLGLAQPGFQQRAANLQLAQGSHSGPVVVQIVPVGTIGQPSATFGGGDGFQFGKQLQLAAIAAV